MSKEKDLVKASKDAAEKIADMNARLSPLEIGLKAKLVTTRNEKDRDNDLIAYFKAIQEAMEAIYMQNKAIIELLKESKK